MWFFNKKKEINYNNLVSTLEKGYEIDILKLLWQPRHGQVEYLPVVTNMLQKLKKTDTSTERLSILKKIEKGNYELIIFSTPWDNSDLPFYPLILDKTTGKVAGVMLPFNELHNHISKKDNSIINDLGAQWTMFTFEYRAKDINV
jgi:hypothetical protein